MSASKRSTTNRELPEGRTTGPSESRATRARLARRAAAQTAFENFALRTPPDGGRSDDGSNVTLPTYVKPGTPRGTVLKQVETVFAQVLEEDEETPKPATRRSIEAPPDLVERLGPGRHEVPLGDVPTVVEPRTGIDLTDSKLRREMRLSMRLSRLHRRTGVAAPSVSTTRHPEHPIPSTEPEPEPPADDGSTPDPEPPADVGSTPEVSIRQPGSVSPQPGPAAADYVAEAVADLDNGNSRKLDERQRADGAAIAGHLASLHVPSPADSPSIQDFQTLRIAFPWVWTEIFDGNLSVVGQGIYLQLQQAADDAAELLEGLIPDEVSTLEALEDLLVLADEITEVIESKAPTVPDDIRDLAGANGFYVSGPAWDSLSPGQRQAMKQLASDHEEAGGRGAPNPAGEVPCFGASWLGNDTNGKPFKGTWFPQSWVQPLFNSFEFVHRATPDPDADISGVEGTTWVDAAAFGIDVVGASSLTTKERANEKGAYVKVPSSSRTKFRLANRTWVRLDTARELARGAVGEQAKAYFSDATQGDQAAAPPPAPADPPSSGLNGSIDALTQLLDEGPRQFKAFHEGSVNFGILANYRQHWEPLAFQVGDLVKTMPLAPKEVRRYKTRVVMKKSRSRKEIESAVKMTRDESGDTNRAETDILKRASNATNFNATAEGKGGIGVVQLSGSTSLGVNAAKESSRSKKNFREAVLKAANEYKQERRTEVSTVDSEEDESTTSGEISNPNEELAVTYLFYELGRRYRLSEEFRDITPVVLVANPLPEPQEVTESWLLRHDWIIKRSLLDDSFLPALDSLRESSRGRDITIAVLRDKLIRQRTSFDQTRTQLASSTKLRDKAADQLQEAVDKQVDAINANPPDMEKATDVGLTVFTGGFFGSAGILGVGGTSGTPGETPEAAEARHEAATELMARLDAERRMARAQLDAASSELNAAVAQYSEAVRHRLDQELSILRLRNHVVANLMHYMQAIWEYEPHDQRYLRLYDMDVPYVDGSVTVDINDDGTATAELAQAGSVTRRRLADIADLENPVGYKGNAMIFPLLEHNYITARMTDAYVNRDGRFEDPDDTPSIGLSGIKDALATMQAYPKEFSVEVQSALQQALELPEHVDDGDEVVVPTSLLFIEALPGSHPLLEDFKLVHRSLDVIKVANEVRAGELDNIRRTALLLDADYSDPEVDKAVTFAGPPMSVTTDI